MRFVLSVLMFAGVASCNSVNPELAAQRCEARARAAMGPTGSVEFGVNSNSGGFSRAEIGISSDFLQGRDPAQVYDACVLQMTGELPIRPPNLRTR
ncbi:MAG: hypothetical protein KC448_03075 [Yoonia sp.]|nr:hypothetical protein [Yoonia sp.]